jgi:xanthine dehydrogenase accessory factor
MSLIEIRIIATKGSTPRDVGARAFVSKDDLEGTIGGGQLEYLAIVHARAMLDANIAHDIQHYPLSPIIGQCCGGHMSLQFQRIDKIEKEKIEMPNIYLFGLGSTGKAIRDALKLLPLNLYCADIRAEYAGLNPQEMINNAPQRAFYLITTHSHALDFAYAEEILSLKQPQYVGMIGSSTKAARFHIYYKQKNKTMDYINNFNSHMGVLKSSDKRPEIIAAMVAAQICQIAFDKSIP